MSQLDIYIDLVNRCAAQKLNYPIANGSPHHARILIAKLFEIADQDVVILSGHLTDKDDNDIDIYGHQPLIEKAVKFIRDPKANLSILLQRGEAHRGNENRFLCAVINDELRCGSVTLIRPQEGIVEVNTPHFMVCDKYAYRYEEKPDPVKTEAIANFGDSNTGKELASYYNDITTFIKKTGKARINIYGPSDRLAA